MGKLKGLLVIILATGIVFGGLFLLAKNNKIANTNLGPATSYEYYWGNGCPHCKVVAEFFDTWTGRDKVQVDKKEVWNDQANYKKMQKRAEACQIPKDQLGVPLLYTPEGKCYVGDQPIIDFFKNLNY